MRYAHGGALPGPETTASTSALQRRSTETGARLELEGTEPSTPRTNPARAASALAGTLTPLQLDLASDVRLINETHADPAFREMRNQTTRGGDERRRAVAGMGRRTAEVKLQRLLPWSTSKTSAASRGNLGFSATASGAVRIWAHTKPPEERLRMVEGLSKGAGLALLAIPMAGPFTRTQAQFQRTLGKYLALLARSPCRGPITAAAHPSGLHGCHGESLGELPDAGAGEGAGTTRCATRSCSWSCNAA